MEMIFSSAISNVLHLAASGTRMQVLQCLL